MCLVGHIDYLINADFASVEVGVADARQRFIQKSQEELWPDALPVATNDFSRVPTKTCELPV